VEGAQCLDFSTTRLVYPLRPELIWTSSHRYSANTSLGKIEPQVLSVSSILIFFFKKHMYSNEHREKDESYNISRIKEHIALAMIKLEKEIYQFVLLLRHSGN
jgi:hypothetical protein